MLWLVFTLFVLLPHSVHAYPEFIGYKYSSCLTCHFNGHGSGPLSDYGRALWAAEIADRVFSGGRNAEKLGEASGFLGSTPLPWWIRPGMKARYLYMTQNPGGREESRSILMQAEGNVALFFKQDQSLGLVASYGHAPIPNRLKSSPGAGDTEEWISREHYLRWQSSESLWWYFGMMDKVYGIRTVNHTAYSRARTGLAMNDQAHGVVAHYIQPTWEVSANGFVGNLYQDADLRQVGGSIMAEYAYREAGRLGASLLHSSNKYVANQRLGVHVRRGYGYGSALLMEVGLIKDSPKSGDARTGYYVFSEAIQRVARGYHVFLSGQAYKDRMESDRPDSLKASFGLLAFPMQRVEFRLEMENTRQIENSPAVSDEFWLMLGQVHIAL
ncbi:MAG: hypothetical protein AB7P49_13020 [Bdellovibrionales bacterium]